jgi:hypothetical protein
LTSALLIRLSQPIGQERQHRDFRLDKLTGMSAFREEGTMFAGLGRHEIFQPTRDAARR